VDGPQDANWRSKVSPATREYQVCDHLRNLNIHKSMGPDKMHPRVPRELADVVAKPLSIVFEKSCSQVKSLVTGKRETMHPFFKKGRKEDPGN